MKLLINNILALITARGGSKSIPDKNIASLAGKPMIAWTIEEALRSSHLDKVFVSTDSPRIAEVSRNYGAEVPFLRPSELAQDDSPHVPVVMHAVEWLESNYNKRYEYVLLLQPTSPFRTASDIDSIIRIGIEKNADCVISVGDALSHPYYLRTVDEKGLIRDMVDRPQGYLRRQDLTNVYSENGALYLIKRDVLMKEKTLRPSCTYAYIMPKERSLDIDSPWDFHLADLIMKDERKGEPR